jgi:hypothetical protein
MSKYDEYHEYVGSVVKQNNIEFESFKSNEKYNGTLEHVSFELGKEYLKHIEQQFPEIKYEDIKEFVILNDKYGDPSKNMFLTSNNKVLYCSPTNMRYIYHALLILTEFKKTNNESIIELGAGYAGLFLAINLFSKKLNIYIKSYNIIELPNVCEFIIQYLTLHKDIISIPVILHKSTTYGKEIFGEKQFFISNFCFTGLDTTERDKYIEHLFPKLTNGLIIGQYIQNILNKTIRTEEETPQTAPNYIGKNYHVYF